jgi:glycosyltransferase involved in cell wall biosynthesis
VHRSAAELHAVLARAAEQPAQTAALSERLRDIVMQRHTYRHRAAQLIAALPAAGAAVNARPVTIGCFSFTRNNPYQELLYADAVAAGVRVVPTWYPMWRGFPRDDGGPLTNQILHVHWTSAVLQRAAGTFSAYRRLDRFRTAIRDFRARGGRLFWTVHNLLPHDVRHRTLEGELFRFLAEQADRIHVLGPATAAAAAPLGGLPAERVTVIEHSNYRGVYPDFVGRDEARRRLGLGDDDRALLLFGEIRPYKGLDLLLTAFRSAASTDARLRLLIAGGVTAGDEGDALLEQCRADPRVVTCFERVPDSDVQVWLRATDLVVLPYRAIVNSGALHLALTFGRPVVAPMAGEVAALLHPDYAAGFAAGDPVDLARAIAVAVETLCTPAAAASASRAADRFPPERMAAEFLALVRGAIDPGCPVPRLPGELPGSHEDRGTSNEGS